MDFFSNIGSEFTKTFIRDNRWMVFAEGLKNTLIITVFATLIGIVIGTAVSAVHAFAAAEKQKASGSVAKSALLALDKVLGAYVAVMRGTPLAVQLLIMNFVIFAGFTNKILVCCIAFGINSGAYVSEVIRGGISSVDIGQTEAGRSLGLSGLTTLWRIVLPQAIKNILPALCNEGIAVLKETSIIGLIAAVDLTRASDLVRSRTLQPVMPLFSIAVIYFLLVYGMSKAVGRLEMKLAEASSR